jgi:hypothetical protein
LSGAFVALTLLSSFVSGCSAEARNDGPVASCTPPASIPTPADVPSDFPWPEDVSLTKAQLKKEFVMLEGFSERSVDELFAGMRPDVIAEGFDIINTDYEGFEAEIYFAKENSLAGIASLREGPCDGYVKVNVIYDPLETTEGRKSVRKTRELSGEG